MSPLRSSSLRTLHSYLSKHWTDLLSLLILVFALLFTLRNVFPAGLYYSHDTFFHFIRQLHFSRELDYGQFPVRWARDLVYDYGYPVFNFTYVLPYYLGWLLGSLGVGIGTSIKTMIVASSLSATIGLFVWLRQHLRPYPSLIGALISWLAPYHFLTVFVTGQLGTITAWAFVPWFLLGVHWLLRARPVRGGVLVALSVAGLITSHLLSLIVFLPFVLAVVGWEYWTATQKRYANPSPTRIKLFALSIFAGLGLSAFYWIPALIELPLVRAGQSEIVPYTDHFVSIKQLLYSAWGYGTSEPGPVDGMSFQVGFAGIAAVGAGIIAIAYAYLKKRSIRTTQLLAALCSGVFLLYLFLMTPYSELVWRVLPGLSSVQHPWRLLGGVVVCAGIIAAVVVSSYRKAGVILGLLLVLLAVVNTRNYMRPMELRYYSDEELLHDLDVNRSGDVAWEFLPIDVPNAPNSQDWSRFEQNGVMVTRESDLIFTTTAEKESSVVLPIFDFPKWQAQVNGIEAEIQRDAGRVLVQVPSGTAILSLQRERSEVQRLSEVITICSIAGILVVLLVSRKKKLR